MCLCFETIKVVNKKALHVEYHNARCNKSRRELFTCKDDLDLESFIKPPDFGEYRCRVVYGKDVESIEFYPLQKREFKSFTCKEIDFKYPYKFLDRSMIEGAKEGIETDDVIFTCKGLLTDTSIANIALFIGGEWLTPKTPLLYGASRARLIDEGLIKEADLSLSHLEDLENFAIMNALIGWEEIIDFSFKRN